MLWLEIVPPINRESPMDTSRNVFPIRHVGNIDFKHDDTPFDADCIISCDNTEYVASVQINRIERSPRIGLALATRILYGTLSLHGETMSVCIIHDQNPCGISLVIRTDADVDKVRCNALMDIIFKMIALYQAHNKGDLNEDVFRLFEAAKGISWAKDAKELNDAVKSIPKVTLPE